MPLAATISLALHGAVVPHKKKTNEPAYPTFPTSSHPKTDLKADGWFELPLTEPGNRSEAKNSAPIRRSTGPESVLRFNESRWAQIIRRIFSFRIRLICTRNTDS